MRKIALVIMALLVALGVRTGPGTPVYASERDPIVQPQAMPSLEGWIAIKEAILLGCDKNPNPYRMVGYDLPDADPQAALFGLIVFYTLNDSEHPFLILKVLNPEDHDSYVDAYFSYDHDGVVDKVILNTDEVGCDELDQVNFDEE